MQRNDVKFTIKADVESNSEEFWVAFDEAFPEIADQVRRSEATIDAATWEAIRSLEGFSDGPSYARDALIAIREDKPNPGVKEWNGALMEEIEIDTEALIEAVDAKTSRAVFEDNYGDGVALIGGRSFKTYHELADWFGLIITHFRK